MDILIVGAGELGTRHLQGILKFKKSQLNVFVFDISDNSLLKARARASEVSHEHQISYIKSFKKVPDKLFLAINATTANHRLKSLEEMLTRSIPRFMILEKVLFQSLEDYHAFESIAANLPTIIYVNHPRRYNSLYREISELNTDKVNMTTIGNGWGLGCNALHFIDLMIFLNKSRLIHIDNSFLDPELSESKRKGFVEFTGALTGFLENGAHFSLISNSSERGPITNVINFDRELWTVKEANGYATRKIFDKELIEERVEYPQIYQSNLTTSFLEDLILNSRCNLTDFFESNNTHKLFIEKMTGSYNSIINGKSKLCPIS